MEKIPENMIAYKKTKTFNQDTIPKGLLNDHNTLEGVWGKIVVSSGELEYTIQTDPPEVLMLSPDKPGVVEPARLHRVKPNGQVEFYVEFYKEQ